MSDAGQEPDAGRPTRRGEAAWKPHLQAIAESNARVQPAGRRERQEREESATLQRRADELRMEAELIRKLDPRYR